MFRLAMDSYWFSSIYNIIEPSKMVTDSQSHNNSQYHKAALNYRACIFNSTVDHFISNNVVWVWALHVKNG